MHTALVARPFHQVDVFTDAAYRGNPVAVVMDAEGLSIEQMQRFERWTNLSEATFVLPPTDPGADYRVRIFTPVAELAFAGHPTVGTCHAWLSAKGAPSRSDDVVQQCTAGLVKIHRTVDGLAFAAPPLLRDGPVEDVLLERIASLLGVARAGIVDAQWADNGPGWVGVLFAGLRGTGVLPERRCDREGSSYRQPERRARALANADRPSQPAVRGEPGDGARPGGPCSCLT